VPVPWTSYTHSSDIITLQCPSAHSRLKLTDRSFIHHAPVLWNSLPIHLRQPIPHCFLPSTTYPTPLLVFPLSSLTLILKPFFFSNYFLLSLLPPTIVRSLASWPGSLFHLIAISLLSFIPTSFIYAIVCELASCSAVIAVWHALYRYSKSAHSSHLLKSLLLGRLLLILLLPFITKSKKINWFLRKKKTAANWRI